MYATVAFVLSLAASTLAIPYITDPVSTTVYEGGQSCTISWIDDGTTPSAGNFSPATIGLYVGSQNMQIQLQSIAQNVNMTNTSSIQFTPNPQVGQNSNQYFIRIVSQSLMDPNHTNAALSIFSAKFEIDNMTGQFNSTVQQMIAGSATSQSVPSASPSPSSTPSNVPNVAASAKTNATGTSTGVTGTATNGAAGGNVVISSTTLATTLMMISLLGLHL